MTFYVTVSVAQSKLILLSKRYTMSLGASAVVTEDRDFTNSVIARSSLCRLRAQGRVIRDRTSANGFRALQR